MKVIPKNLKLISKIFILAHSLHFAYNVRAQYYAVGHSNF